MLDIIRDKKGIFFDVGYTLDRPASGDWMLTNKAVELIGGRERVAAIPCETLNAAFSRAMKYLDENHLVTTVEGELSQFKHFYSILNEDCALSLPSDAIDAIACDRTFNMENYVFYDDAYSVVSELSKTHALGIISDTWPSIREQLEHGRLTRFFKSFTFSCELGTYKPDARMYEDAIRKIGLLPEETVFIDDSVRNLEGAAKLGITPILIAANSASDVPTEFLKIHSLSELLG